MSRVLFLTMHQLTGHSGGAIASRAAAHIVSGVFGGRCRIITPTESLQVAATIPHEELVPVAARGRLQKAFYFALACNADRFTPYVDRHLAELLDGVSHVFIDGSMIGRFAGLVKKRYPQVHVTQLHHNFEHAYYADIRMNPLSRCLHRRITDRNQGGGWKHADLSLVFTPKDLADITACYGPAGGQAAVYGYYEPLSPACPVSLPQAGVTRLVITGNMSAAKGYEGVIWFLKHVWGSVDATRYSLVIAGRNPVAALQAAAAQHPNVKLIANPPDMTQVLCDADIYLNPCSGGSGIKIRNLDGLRTGLPTLCRRGNEYGFEGLPADVFAVFEDGNDFALRLAALNVGNHARVRAAYESHFSLQAGIARLSDLLGVA